jgi:hypothetical protein
MSDIIDLSYLIKNMNPALKNGEFVFCNIDTDIKNILESSPLLILKTVKGYSALVSRQSADKYDYDYENVFSLITLCLPEHESEAEFLAVITGVFADQGIPVKLFSGFNNSCGLLVPVFKTDDAMQLLNDLTTDF